MGRRAAGAGERVLSVRQNLSPLVSGGTLSPDIADLGAWGATIANATVVPRSSLGMDVQGNILYAAGMSALPVDLGQALITTGAVTAMELDINPEWVQLALAPNAGGPLVAGVPGQNRPADQYLAGWTATSSRSSPPTDRRLSTLDTELSGTQSAPWPLRAGVTPCGPEPR